MHMYRQYQLRQGRAAPDPRARLGPKASFLRPADIRVLAAKGKLSMAPWAKCKIKHISDLSGTLDFISYIDLFPHHK